MAVNSPIGQPVKRAKVGRRNLSDPVDGGLNLLIDSRVEGVPIGSDRRTKNLEKNTKIV